MEELVHVGITVAMGSTITRAPHAGSAIECLDFEAGVVGKAIEPIVLHHMARLDFGIAFQGGRILDNLLMATNVRQALNLVLIARAFLGARAPCWGCGWRRPEWVGRRRSGGVVGGGPC